MGGLNLTSYQSLLDAGVITSGDPDASELIQKIAGGTHMGKLSDDDLDSVIEWIRNGTPEK